LCNKIQLWNLPQSSLVKNFPIWFPLFSRMTQSVNKNDKFYKFVAKCKPTVLTMFSFQLLQNLGKADRTTDEIFEEHLQNFNLQQSNANRLQKDISNYIRCIRGKKWKTFFLTSNVSKLKFYYFYHSLQARRKFKSKI
jgi:hypothetical protein